MLHEIEHFILRIFIHLNTVSNMCLESVHDRYNKLADVISFLILLCLEMNYVRVS